MGEVIDYIWDNFLGNLTRGRSQKTIIYQYCRVGKLRASQRGNIYLTTWNLVATALFIVAIKVSEYTWSPTFAHSHACLHCDAIVRSQSYVGKCFAGIILICNLLLNHIS